MANPNPSPSTRIGAENGPAPGKTSEAKRLEMLNAEAAVRIRARFLAAVERKLNPEGIDDETVDAAVLAMLDGNMLTLMKDSETRGLGAPVQRIGGEDGGAIVFKTIYETRGDK